MAGEHVNSKRLTTYLRPAKAQARQSLSMEKGRWSWRLNPTVAIRLLWKRECVLVRVSIAVKRHLIRVDQGNSYRGQHLIGAG